jgi:hypothetical protein
MLKMKFRIIIFYLIISLPIFPQNTPTLIYIGEIYSDDASDDLIYSIKSLIRHSVRKSSPAYFLILEEESEKSQIEHIQKNLKKADCKNNNCSEWMEKNLDIDLKITGKVDLSQNKLRVVLRLISTSTGKPISSKEGIFSEEDLEFYIFQITKSLLIKSYSPDDVEKRRDLQFSFPDIEFENHNPDLQIFTYTSENEKIITTLKNLEKKILQADVKFREKDFESALNIYSFVYDKISSTFTASELNSIDSYVRSIVKRKTSALENYIVKEVHNLDRLVRFEKLNTDNLLGYQKEYNRLLTLSQNSEKPDPDVVNSILLRLSKLEFIIVKTLEKDGDIHNYYGKFNDAEKSYEKIKKILEANSKLKNVSPFLKIINKKIESNQKDSVDSVANRIKTLFFIAEKEYYNKNIDQLNNDNSIAIGAEAQMKFCLDKAEKILLSNKRENPTATTYYKKIQDLFKFKNKPEVAKKQPWVNSPYFVDYSLLWHSLYFPGLGQELALPDESFSQKLFFTGILSFVHVLYRAQVYNTAVRTYNSADRIDPFLLYSLDSSIQSYVYYTDNLKFQSLKSDIDSTAQNLNTSLGIFGLVYFVSLGDAIITYSKGNSLSFNKQTTPGSIPMGYGALDLKVNYQPQDWRNVTTVSSGEYRYGLQYSQKF